MVRCYHEFCHCSMGPSQCTHSMHVHVAMPGLREQPNGQYEPVARSGGRYVLKIPMGEFKYQDALRRYVHRGAHRGVV